MKTVYAVLTEHCEFEGSIVPAYGVVGEEDGERMVIENVTDSLLDATRLVALLTQEEVPLYILPEVVDDFLLL